MPASASSTPVTNVPLPRWARNGTSPSMRCADESNTTPDVQSNVSTARPTNRTFTTLPGGGGPVVGDPPALPGTVISFTTAPSPVRSSPSGSSCRGVRSSMAFANSLPPPKGRAPGQSAPRARARPEVARVACTLQRAEMNIWGISFRSAYRSEAGDPDRRAMAQESREKISYRFDLRKQTRKRERTYSYTPGEAHIIL